MAIALARLSGSNSADAPAGSAESADGKSQNCHQAWGTFRCLNGPLAIDPGRACLLRFQYRSTGTICLNRRLRLPEGWQVVSAKGQLALTGGAPELDIASIVPAKGAPAGNYALELVHFHESREYPAISLPIEVLPRRKLEIDAQAPPRALTQGQTLNWNVRLRNSGNASLSLRASHTSNLGVDLKWSCQELVLNPQEERVLTISAKGWVLPRSKCDWFLTLLLRGELGELCGKASLTCPIYRTESQVRHRYENTIRTQAQVMFSSDGRLQDLVWQWSGSGHLDVKRKKLIDFFAQVPSQNKRGAQDPTYKGRISLQGPQWRIDLGDSTYSLSQLTLPSLTARGARIARNWSMVQLALFGLRERDYLANRPKRGKQLGGAVTLLTDFSEFQFEFLDKRNQRDARLVAGVLSDHRRLCSAQIKTPANALGRLSLALARNVGATAHRQERGRSALKVQWQTPFKCPWQGSAHWSQHQSGFWGNARDRKEGMLFFARDLRPLYISLRGFYGCDNPRARPGRTARQTRDVALTLRGPVTKRIKASGELSQRAQSNRLRYGQSQTSLGVTPGLTFTGDQWTVDGLLGAHLARDHRYGPATHSRWCPQLNVEYQLMLGLRVYWCGSWGAKSLAAQRDSRNHRLGLFWNPSPGTTLGLAATNSGGRSRRNKSYVATLNWRPKADHMLRCTYNAHLARRRARPKTHSFALHYSIFFGIPIGKPIGGEVSGSVRDVCDPKSSHRYVVCLGGHRSLTDGSGRYLFKGVPSGEYPLWLENLPREKIEVNPNSLKVAIESGQRAVCDLQTVDSCRIRGSVAITRDDKKIARDNRGRLTLSDNLQSPQGYAGAVIALWRKGSERKVAKTSDSSGVFGLEQLVPGHWIAELREVKVPRNCQIVEPVRREFDLKPGEVWELHWNILPIERKLKLADETRD